MDAQYFDALARRFAESRSRRSLFAGIGGVFLASRLESTSAQTPDPCDSDDDCGLCEICQNPPSGVCVFVLPGQDPNSDCAEGVCNGSGVCGCAGPLSPCDRDLDCCPGNTCLNEQCLLTNGIGCAFDNWCASGFCVDAMCCSTACEATTNCLVAICPEGQCSTALQDCSELDELCKGGICDSSTGNCVAVNHDDGFVCGSNATCSNGVCACVAGSVSCGGECVAGECCESADCTMQEPSECASMICQDNTCQIATSDEACGPCRQCDLESLYCVESCRGSECCCDDNATCSADCCQAECDLDTDCPQGLCCCNDSSCSADCCPDSCKGDKDCPTSECCCKNGACDAKCCKSEHQTTPPPPPSSSDSSDPAASVLPSTGTGSTAGGERGVGLAVAAGITAWVASRMRSARAHDSSEEGL